MFVKCSVDFMYVYMNVNVQIVWSKRNTYLLVSCVIRDQHCCNWPQYKIFASFPPDGWSIFFFLHQTIHIKKEKGLTVQLISYSVHGKSMFFDAHPVLPVSQQWIHHMYILLLLFWSPLLLWSRLSWLKFFFVIFCHLVSSTRAMRRRYGGQEGCSGIGAGFPNLFF